MNLRMLQRGMLFLKEKGYPPFSLPPCPVAFQLQLPLRASFRLAPSRMVVSETAVLAVSTVLCLLTGLHRLNFLLLPFPLFLHMLLAHPKPQMAMSPLAPRSPSLRDVLLFVAAPHTSPTVTMSSKTIREPN